MGGDKLGERGTQEIWRKCNLDLWQRMETRSQMQAVSQRRSQEGMCGMETSQAPRSRARISV